ncbi:MAG TPA: hypothetical protein VGB99_02995 [Acidobacteriota bacterium]
MEPLIMVRDQSTAQVVARWDRRSLARLDQEPVQIDLVLSGTPLPLWFDTSDTDRNFGLFPSFRQILPQGAPFELRRERLAAILTFTGGSFYATQVPEGVVEFRTLAGQVPTYRGRSAVEIAARFELKTGVHAVLRVRDSSEILYRFEDQGSYLIEVHNGGSEAFSRLYDAVSVAMSDQTEPFELSGPTTRDPDDRGRGGSYP